MGNTEKTSNTATYSYLGPAGTFTEAALKLVPEAHGATWKSVNNVGEALADVTNGVSVAAMIAIENSVEGGVTATQDALANIPDLRIIGEYLIPVQFDLVAKKGTTLSDVSVINAHPVAYAQCRGWLEQTLPHHGHIPSASNVAAVSEQLESDTADAAIGPTGISEHYDVEVLASAIADNPNAQTRFVLVSKTTDIPEPTGSDKTSLIVELPEDRSGALLEMLEQFATRGVNLTLIQSRPIGDEFGRYRFVIDAEGHVRDERVADALLGLRRFSPRVIFLGSYPRADQLKTAHESYYADDVFTSARAWLAQILGENDK
jgi:prephenate dehydratase